MIDQTERKKYTVGKQKKDKMLTKSTKKKILYKKKLFGNGDLI